MSGFLTFLIILGLLMVALEYTNRHRKLFVEPPGKELAIDRDRARMIADLRARRD